MDAPSMKLSHISFSDSSTNIASFLYPTNHSAFSPVFFWILRRIMVQNKSSVHCWGIKGIMLNNSAEYSSVSKPALTPDLLFSSFDITAWFH